MLAGTLIFYTPHRFVSQSFVAPQRLQVGVPLTTEILWLELHRFFWNIERGPKRPHFLHMIFPITGVISWFSVQGFSNSPVDRPHFLQKIFPTIRVMSCVPAQGLPKSVFLPHAVQIVWPCNDTILCSIKISYLCYIAVQNKNYHFIITTSHILIYVAGILSFINQKSRCIEL
jgi:hypothetical protein